MSETMSLTNTPLPEERLGLLFDLGDPPKQVTFEEMSANGEIGEDKAGAAPSAAIEPHPGGGRAEIDGELG